MPNGIRTTTPRTRPVRPLTIAQVNAMRQQLLQGNVLRDSGWNHMYSTIPITVFGGTTTPVVTPPVQEVAEQPQPTIAVVEEVPPPPPPPPPPRQTLADLYPTDRNSRNRRNTTFHNVIVKYNGNWCVAMCTDYDYSIGGDYNSLLIVPLDQYYAYAYGGGDTRYDPSRTVSKKFSELYPEDLETYYKAGLLTLSTGESVFVKDDAVVPGGTAKVGLPLGSLTTNHRLLGKILRDHQSLVNMLEGVYGSVAEIWENISKPVVEDKMQCAISSNFSLGRTTLSVVTLLYKGEQVGEVVLQPNGVTRLEDMKIYPAYPYVKRVAKTELGLDFGMFTLN